MQDLSYGQPMWDLIHTRKAPPIFFSFMNGILADQKSNQKHHHKHYNQLVVNPKSTDAILTPSLHRP